MLRLLLLLFLYVPAFAQVTITGEAKPYKNQELRVIVFEDYVTQKEKTIATAFIDSAGNFSVSADVKRTTYIELKTSKVVSSFYAEKGKSYNVTLFPPDPEQIQTIGKETPVRILLNNTDSLELNNQIASIDKTLDDFFTKNLELFIRKAAKQKVDSFKVKVYKKYSYLQDDYLKNYLKYNLATIDQGTIRRKEVIFNEYLTSPVLHRHKAYMDFFNEYFIKHLTNLSLGKKGDLILREINDNRSAAGLMKAVLTADTLLVNDTLRELVILKGLYEMYYQPKANQRNIEMLLASFSKNGMHEENRKIAANILKDLTSLKKGSPAPNFELPNIKGGDARLADYKGKYVFIDFWAIWCQPCLQEMKVMSNLKEKYGNQIEFISISIDDKEEDVKKFLERNKYDWTFLYAGDHEKIKSLYQVKSVPYYVLIDREGDILAYPAAKPSENIEKTFSEITKKK